MARLHRASRQPSQPHTLHPKAETHRLDRVLQPLHNALIRKVELGHVLVVLRERLARDGELRAVDEVRVLQEVLHERGDAARLVEVLHDVLAGRSVGEVKNNPSEEANRLT